MIWLPTLIAVPAVIAAIVLDVRKDRSFRPWVCREWRNLFAFVGLLATLWAVGLAVREATWQHVAGGLILIAIVAVLVAGAICAVSEVVRRHSTPWRRR